MTKRLLVSMVIAALVLMALGPSSALAGAYETTFETYITYQNIGSATTTTLAILLYDSPTDTDPTVINQPNLAKYGSTSVGIGTLVSGAFQGTAVLSADQPMAATLVQLPKNSTTVKVRPMSNGFSQGTQQQLVATVLKNAFNAKQYTKMAVQNAGNTDTTVTVKFYNTSAVKVHEISQLLKPGAGLHVDAGAVSQLGTTFNGSAVIDTSPAGSIVSSAMEMDSGTSIGAKAFEGVGQGDTKVYMPSALCDFYTAAGLQNSYYAVQNTSSSQTANVTVNYSNGASETVSIGPYAKATLWGCVNPAGQAANSNFIGAATIVSNNSVPIIAMGKINGAGLSTAFVGFSSGAAKVALPYVRYAANDKWNAGTMQRAFIAIQNVGTSAISGNITVQYINPDGTVAGTHTITGGLAVGEKVNSNATNAGLSSFGCYNSCTTYGGGAVITAPAGSQLAVIARVNSNVPATGLRAGEDTSGIAIP